MRHILPVREVLKSKRMWIGGGCPLCTSEVETISHILCECPIARQLWCCNDVLQGRTFVEFVLRNSDEQTGITMAARFWVMWMVRNDAVWNGKQWQTSEMLNYVNSLLATW